MSYYLYAIIKGSVKQEFGSIGIGGSTVFTVPAKGMSAVVSEVGDNNKLRPERRNLAAYQKVLKTLMEKATPLPVAFGVQPESLKSVLAIINKNREALNEQAARVKGRMEMSLRVSWNAPNIFQYFVETHPELRAARDRYYIKKHGPSQEDKIELGRMFDRLLNEDRETHTDQVTNTLSRHSVEIKELPCRDERLVMNLACLVERDLEKEFEDAIFEAAGHFSNSFSFDYNGPMVPHYFVELELSA